MKQFDVPIIQPDLRHEEAMVQAIHLFDYLNKIVDEVFNKIDARISNNITKISDLDDRIERASSKVDSFKNSSSKAINIFSPAKYPAADLVPSFTPTFVDLNPDIKLFTNHKVLNSPVDHRNYAEKLKFFHIKKSKRTLPQQLQMPFNIKSINSTIMFNTNENILIKEVARKVIKSVRQFDLVQSSTEVTDFSLLSSKMRNKNRDNTISYLPHLNNAPQLELPNDLPDLPGIAGDVRFDMSSKDKTIAPSLMNIIGDLPDLLELETSTKEQQSTLILSNAENPSAPTNVSSNVEQKKPEVSAHAPPPLPTALMSQDIPPAPKMVHLAPPPPPPPPMSGMIPDPPKPPKKIEAMKAASSESAMRNNLMESIRNAAGKVKNRAVEAEIIDNKKEAISNKDKPKAGGNLMDDLHNKLLMRRKGISGTQQQNAANANNPNNPVSIMDKLSSIIPPPPKNLRQNTSSDDSTDDNDKDDWE